MAEINVTPLVDVMLVLLVIFIITAPLLAYAIRLDLPDVKAAPVATKTEAIKLSIDAEGHVFWNADPSMPRILRRGSRARRPNNRNPTCTCAPTRRRVSSASPR
jgi:biopolymer transport protein ExbD